MTEQQRWCAGVDWASENHHGFITDRDGGKMAEKIFKHGGESLAEMAVRLMATSSTADPGEIHIAMPAGSFANRPCQPNVEMPSNIPGQQRSAVRRDDD